VGSHCCPGKALYRLQLVRHHLDRDGAVDEADAAPLEVTRAGARVK
jgi:hypothetical protein